MVEIAVVGGGMSGLSCAHWLMRRATAVNLRLFEANSYLGGTVHTVLNSGFYIEAGPNAFLDNKPETIELTRAVGLEPQLVRADQSAARRFIACAGRLYDVPQSPAALMRSTLLPLGGRLRLLTEPFRSRGAKSDESIAEFGRRRLGRWALERLIDPVVTGIFAGDVNQLSMASAFPQIKALELNHGSLLRGMLARRRSATHTGKKLDAGATRATGGLLSFRYGMGELPAAIARQLGDRLRIAHRLVQLNASTDQRWEMRFETPAGFESVKADLVILALPAFTVGELLRSVSAEAAAASRAISYSSAVVVGLGFAPDQFKPPRGFGFLVPSMEKKPILGCLFASTIFPGYHVPDGHAMVRVILGGAHWPQLVDEPDDQVTRLVCNELSILFREPISPILVEIIRWKRAIPQYTIGHQERVLAIDRLSSQFPSLFVIGNAFRGVAMTDCVAAGKRTAGKVVERLRAQ